MLQPKLHKGQYDVATDTHRFRVVCAGRRWGKSVLAQLIILDWATRNVGLYWIVSPTYKSSKMIHWRDLQKIIPKQWIEKKNEVELSITLKNGSVIELKGADNPDALRGIKLRGLVVDECASIKDWDWLWPEVLRPTLTDYEAPALFIGTPKGFNSFFDLYNLGIDINETWKSYHFSSYDNPYIKSTEIDSARKELTEDTFAQEYMADFRKHTGLAHKPWDRDIHLIEPFDVPTHWQRMRGFDYGTVHYTASPRIAIDDEDNWFVEVSYLDNKHDPKGHAEAILAQDYGLGMILSWGDPSGKQWVEEFAMHGLNINDADKTVGQGFNGWVEFCVDKVNERLKPKPGHTVYLTDGRKIENAPSLFVLNNGKNDKFVSQIERLSWKTTSTGDNIPILEDTGDPTGGHYDLMAALRYLAVSYKGKQADLTLPPTHASQRNWSLSDNWKPPAKSFRIGS